MSVDFDRNLFNIINRELKFTLHDKKYEFYLYEIESRWKATGVLVPFYYKGDPVIITKVRKEGESISDVIHRQAYEMLINIVEECNE